MAEVLYTGYQLLRRHPHTVNLDQLKRYLRQARAYQATEAGRAAITLELAHLLISKGQEAEAYDILTSMPRTSGAPPGVAFKASHLLGDIRLGQWEHAMRQSLQPRGIQRAEPGPEWDPYAVSVQQWNRAGRAGRELGQEAEAHYATALRLEPRATGVAMQLVGLTLAKNKPAVALEAAEEQAVAVPDAADPHAFAGALLLDTAPSVIDLGDDAALRVARHMCASLEIDPYVVHAASGM